MRETGISHDSASAADSDVVVVGAGVIGLSIAWHLLGDGATVTVVERTGVGAGASGVQPGGVRRQWSTEVNCRLAEESATFYRELGRHLSSPVNPVLESCGYLFTADTEEELGRLRRNVAVQNRCGIPSQVLSPAEAAEVVEGLRHEGLAGAAWCGDDGYFDKPQSVVEAFAAGVVERGGAIVIANAVRLSRSLGGWTIVLGDGSELHGNQVVVAAGHESRSLLAPLGVDPPIEAEPRYLFLSEPIRERLLEPLVVAGERRFAAKQLANGRVLASDLGAEGPPEEHQAEWRRTVAEGIRSLVPILEYVSFPVMVDGIYDVTPDNQPIVDGVPGQAGLWLAAGLSGHGFMFAPSIGRMLAAAVRGDDGAVPDQFALGRFQDQAIVRETQVV